MRDGERPFSELASAEARVAELRAERDAAIRERDEARIERDEHVGIIGLMGGYRSRDEREVDIAEALADTPKEDRDPSDEAIAYLLDRLDAVRIAARAERDAAVKALEGLREAAEGTMSALASWSSVRPSDPDYGGIPAAALEMAHALRAALDAALSPPTPAATVEAPTVELCRALGCERPMGHSGAHAHGWSEPDAGLGEAMFAEEVRMSPDPGPAFTAAILRDAAAPPSAPSDADRRVGEIVGRPQRCSISSAARAKRKGK
jgi:hypothetical protein